MRQLTLAQVNRMAGLTSLTEQASIAKAAIAIQADLIDDGFEPEDAKAYVLLLVEEALSK